MILYDTYVIKLWAPDRDLTPDQEDALFSDAQRFDEDLRKLIADRPEHSALVIAIGGGNGGC